jgi:hypothetical protein
MNTEWVIFDSLDPCYRCTRCGDTYKPNLPCPLTTFVAMGKDFIVLHAKCKAKAGAA